MGRNKAPEPRAHAETPSDGSAVQNRRVQSRAALSPLSSHLFRADAGGGRAAAYPAFCRRFWAFRFRVPLSARSAVPGPWHQSLRDGGGKQREPEARSEVCKSLYGRNKRITPLLEIWRWPCREARLWCSAIPPENRTQRLLSVLAAFSLAKSCHLFSALSHSNPQRRCEPLRSRCSRQLRAKAHGRGSPPPVGAAVGAGSSARFIAFGVKRNNKGEPHRQGLRGRASPQVARSRSLFGFCFALFCFSSSSFFIFLSPDPRL